MDNQTNPQAPATPDIDDLQSPAGDAIEVPPQRRALQWVVAAVAALILAYPLVQWARSQTPAPGASVAEALNLSFQHYQAGRYAESIAAAQAALAAQPTSADAYNNIAVAYLALGKHDEAIKAAQEALRLRPDFALARNNLQWIQQEKAKATGQPLPDAALIAQSDALLTQSLQHFQAGRYRECMDTAAESARVNPNPRALNNVGICAGQLQLWDEAIRNTEEAIRLDPTFQLAKNNLAWLQQRRLETRK